MATKWSFLTEEYIHRFCNPRDGKEMCRYLMMDSEWSCEKGTLLGRQIDDKIKGNSIVARGDNCPGVIGLLCEGKLAGSLEGKKVLYEQFGPPYRVMGVVEKMSMNHEMLRLKAQWDDGHKFVPAFVLGFLTMYINGGTVVVSSALRNGSRWIFYLN